MIARRHGGLPLALSVAGVLATLVVVITATLMAILGSEIACVGGGGGSAVAAPPTPDAVKEIPPARLKIYQEAGERFDVDWAFLASIGYQECGHGACAEVNPSGCGGPMQIGMVRESACSPGPGPTIWERYRVDADGGGADPFNAADAIFTAGRMMRPVFGLAGDSYAAYHEVACNYYGACSDGVANYADEVMARAVEYGFRGRGAPRPKSPVATDTASSTGSSSCGSTSSSAGATGNAIVRIARSQLGTGESPPGSNCNPYGPCVQWCSLFVSWVWKRAGVPLTGSTAAYAYSGSLYLWTEAREGGPLAVPTLGDESPPGGEGGGARVLPPTATPSPGDAVFYGTGPGYGEDEYSEHVGLVERVFPGGQITTIDGNFGDRVARSGPFLPLQAAAYGMPGPIYGYAHPPSSEGEGGANG
jgi:CHAP domain